MGLCTVGSEGYVPCGLFLAGCSLSVIGSCKSLHTESRCCVPVGLILICGFYQIFTSDSVGFLSRVQNFLVDQSHSSVRFPSPSLDMDAI